MPVRIHVVHEIRGRVRLRVEPAAVLTGCEGERFADYLRASPGVGSVRFNRRCRSAIVQGDPQRVSGERLAARIAEYARDVSTGAPEPEPRFGDTLVSRVGAAETALADSARSLLSKVVAAIKNGPSLLEHLPSMADRESSDSGSQEFDGNGRELSLLADASAKKWFTLSVDELLGELEAGANGLSAEEARERLARYGHNRLETIEGRSAWAIFAEQFANLPVGLLIGSAAISVATGGTLDAVVILAVVAINGVIGHVTESHAEQTITSLVAPGHPPAELLRDGSRRHIDAEEMVPGDIVFLSPATYIAADARLLESHRLTVDESTLTGESMPASKDAEMHHSEKTPLRERGNMVYRGTVVTGGNGKAVVVATGGETEVGKIQRMVGTARPPETPIQRQMREMGTRLGLISGAVCGGVFVLGIARGYGLLEMLKASITLAVAAVPEGLPAVATTTLALGVNKMRRKGILVRHLDAVETLGAVQVFCLDKTGTLTRNEMTAVRLLVAGEELDISETGIHSPDRALQPLEHPELRKLLEVIALCNETTVQEQDGKRQLAGSPTEAALMRLALDAGIDLKELRTAHKHKGTEYRTEQRGIMTTRHRLEDGRLFLAVKGRPTDVLERCRWKLQGGEVEEFDTQERTDLEAANDRLAGDALRVLGVAYRTLDESDSAKGAELVWLGLVGIADPVRKGVDELIDRFHQAGIRTTMITGDQSATAYAIGRQLNLSGSERLDMLDSTQLEDLDPDVLKSLAQQVNVFSAVSPSHKLQIVQALQRAGLVVAMTGDGVNDGPALKAADVGVAMGEGGAEVASRVADIVLKDDRLETIVIAIRQGRAIYANTRRAIHFLLATNMSEILVMLGGIAARAGQPLNPRQLLWVNLISDIFPVLALAVEPPEPGVMQRPPRLPDEQLLEHRHLRRIGWESTIMGAGSLVSYGWGVSRYGVGERASTLAFMSLMTGQLLHMLTAGSDSISLSRLKKAGENDWVLPTWAAGTGLQALTVVVPGLRRFLGTAPVSLLDAAVALGGSVGPFALNEWLKSVSRESETGETQQHASTS